MQAKTQCSMGRFYAEVHQVQDRELSHLYRIREDLTQRQVSLSYQNASVWLCIKPELYILNCFIGLAYRGAN